MCIRDRKKGYAVGYRNGTTKAKKGLNLMDEDGLGSEVIISKYGVLQQFKGGEPVSYTHLDVYKRQDTYLIGIWSLIINALIQLFYSTLHIIFFSNIDFNESFKLLVYVLSLIHI